MGLITDKLDAASGTEGELELLFRFRDAVEEIYDNIVLFVERVDDITADTKFNNIDSDLKAEGVQIRNIIRAVKVALDEHIEFLSWRE